MMPMTLSNPDSNTINALREMMRQGLLSEDDLANLSVSANLPEQGQSNNAPLGMFNAPNQLAPIIQGPQAGLNQWDKLQSGEGVIQSSNGDGSLNAPIRINKVPPPTWNPQTQGSAGIVQRPMGAEQTAAGAERDMSRPEVQLFGKAPGYYGKDGKVYHKDGTVTTILPEGSLANFHAQQKQQMGMQKFEADQEHTNAQTDLLKVQAKAAAAKTVAPRLGTVGQQAVDRNFAKDYADYQAGGGSADVEKQLKQLSDVSKELGKEGNNYTGGFRGLVPDKIRSITNPDAIAAKNKVEEVAQRNLRLVLGAQFTQVEGERLIARAYNDQMKPEENQRRVDALFNQIKIAAKTKDDAARYFEENGTLTGWKGRLPTLGDFDAAIDSAGSKAIGGNTVTLPDGRVKTFPNAAAAASFKKAAGLL